MVRRISALLVAVMLLSQICMTAFATVIETEDSMSGVSDSTSPVTLVQKDGAFKALWPASEDPPTDAIHITNSDDVTVNASVHYGASAAATVKDSNVTFNGDIENDTLVQFIREKLDGSGHYVYDDDCKLYASGRGLLVDENSSVTVNGNIKSDVDVIEVHDSSVTVNGQVKSDGLKTYKDGPNYYPLDPDSIPDFQKSFMDTGFAVNAENSMVNVNKTNNPSSGDVVSESGGVKATNNSEISVAGSVNAAQTAIDASQSKVQVGGDVTSLTVAVKAELQSDVSVKSVTVLENTSLVEQIGVDATSGSKVNVTEDVNSASAGVRAYNPNTSVTIGGEINAEDTGIEASRKATVTAKAVTAGQTAISVTDEGTSVTVDGDVDSKNKTGVDAKGGTVTVGGDVKGAMGLYAGENAAVEVAGTITGSSDAGAKISGGASLKADAITGKYGVEAQGDNTQVAANTIIGTSGYGLIASKGAIAVATDVVGQNFGIGVSDQGTKVTVENVTAEAGTAVDVAASGSVEITSSVSAQGSNATAIRSDSTGQVTVMGDATSEGTGLAIQLRLNDPATGTIIVDGTLASEDSAFVISNSANDMTAEEMLNALPEVIVYEADSNSGSFVAIDSSAVTGDAANALAETIAQEKIEYIIKSNAEHGTITFTTGTKASNGYIVANEGEITIKIIPESGYGVSTVTGGNAAVVALADGSYSIIVPRGGGVDIYALCQLLSNSGNGNNSQNSTPPSPSQKKTSASTAMTADGKTVSFSERTEGTEFIMVVQTLDGKEINQGTEQIESSLKLEGLTKEQEKLVRSLDARNRKSIPLQDLRGYVFGKSIRISVDAAPKDVILYASSNRIKEATVIFLNTDSNEWSAIPAEIDPVTHLIHFTATGNGIVSLLFKT